MTLLIEVIHKQAESILNRHHGCIKYLTRTALSYFIPLFPQPCMLFYDSSLMLSLFCHLDKSR